MNRREEGAGRVDGFSVAIDMACLASIGATVIGGLLLLNHLAAWVIANSPAVGRFILEPWVAPALVGCGIFLLVAVAALLLSMTQGEGE